MADVRMSVVVFQTPAAIDATFNIAHTLGAAPKVAIFFTTRHANSDGAADTGQFMLGLGATDGTRQWAIAGNSQTAAATTNTGTICYDTVCAIGPTVGAGAAVQIASFVSWDSSEVILNFSTADGVARDWLMVVLGGADLSAYVNDFDIANGDNVITGVGFEPDVILAASTDAVFSETGENDLDLAWGVAANDGVPTHRSMAMSENDNVAAAVPGSILSTGTIRESVAGSPMSSDGTITAFGADGFTWTSTAIGNSAGYIALKFGGAPFKVGTLATKTSTGTQAYTDPALRPIGVLLCMTSVDVVDILQSDADAGGVGFSAFTATEEGAISGAIQDAADPTVTEMNTQEHALMCGYNGDASAIIADFVSMNSNGFTLDFTATDGTARQGWYLAFGALDVPSAVTSIAFRQFTPLLLR